MVNLRFNASFKLYYRKGNMLRSSTVFAKAILHFLQSRIFITFLSGFLLFPQLWLLTSRKGGLSWKTCTVILCMKLSWWLARMVEAWMGQELILRSTPLVSVLSCSWIQRCYSNESILYSECFFGFRSGDCDWHNIIFWSGTDSFYHYRDSFLQLRMVRPLLFFFHHLSCHLFLKAIWGIWSSFWLSFCRLKVHFWPVVPDPANSSIKRWSSESTQALEICLIFSRIAPSSLPPSPPSLCTRFHYNKINTALFKAERVRCMQNNWK